MDWLAAHAGTAGTALVVGAVLFFAVRKIIRDVKKGRPCCGGNCAACGCCRSSYPEKTAEKGKV